MIDLLKKHSPAICIHCAGRSSVAFSLTEPSADFYDATVLNFEILNALRLHAPDCRYLFLSSAAVYGNPKSLPVKETDSPDPVSPYGFHKYQCEQSCLEFSKIYGMSTASLRLFSAYGPGLRRQVLWDICQKIFIHKSLSLQGTGKESRDFIHAIDIARSLKIVAENAPMQGEIYNVGSGREVKIEELTRMILSETQSNLSPRFDGVVPQGTPLNWKADISKLESLGYPSPCFPGTGSEILHKLVPCRIVRHMTPPFRIALFNQYDQSWVAGTEYIRNIVFALSSLAPEERNTLEISLITRKTNDGGLRNRIETCRGKVHFIEDILGPETLLEERQMESCKPVPESALLSLRGFSKESGVRFYLSIYQSMQRCPFQEFRCMDF